jgi:hypothetical protein
MNAGTAASFGFKSHADGQFAIHSPVSLLGDFDSFQFSISSSVALSHREIKSEFSNYTTKCDDSCA